MRRAAIVQLPAGRSVKMTVAPVAASRSRINASTPCAERSRLLTPRKSSARPVICSTADNNPSANVPWPATIALTLLIVLHEILPRVAGLFHPVHEALIERLRRILPVILEQVVHRDDLGDHRDVFSGTQVHRDLGQFDAGYRPDLAFESRALDLNIFSPRV